MQNKFRFILVGPEYELNLGAAARLMRNFGQSPLYLVKPNCLIGFTARMHAKHAAGILEKAVVCKSLEEAVAGCTMVVGTTGVIRRHRDALRHPLSLEEFGQRMAGQKTDPRHPVAILFGREGNGLAEDEIARCDVLITIPTQKRYPVMNLSHAMAVVLYALRAPGRKTRALAPADAHEAAYLRKTTDALTDRFAARLRNPKKTKLAFRRVLGRALPDEVETRALLSVLQQALRGLQKK